MKEERRGFLKMLGLGAAASLVPVITVGVAIAAKTKPPLPHYRWQNGPVGVEEWNAVIDRINLLSDRL